MANGIRTGDPIDSIKDVVWSSVKVPQVQQTPEEGRRTYQPKRYRNNNNDKDNSPKTLNDKNQQASSQKFRQLIKRAINKKKKKNIYIYNYSKEHFNQD